MFALTIALGLAASGPPDAQEFGLQYAVDDACPTQAEFLRIVEQDLGRPVLISPQSEVSVEISIASEAGQFQLQFSAGDGDEDPEGSELTALDCEVLVRAAALRASLALFDASPPKPPPPRPVEAPPEPLPEPPAPVDKAPRATPSSRTERSPLSGSGWDARALGGGEFGGAGVHGLVALAVGWRSRHARIEVRGTYLTPSRYRLGDNSASIRAQLGTVTAAGCLLAQTRRLEVPACVAVDAGVLRARGLVGEQRVTHQPWLAALFRTGVVWWARANVGLAANAEAGPLLIRPGIRLTGVPVGYRAGQVSARLIGGAVVRLERR